MSAAQAITVSSGSPAIALLHRARRIEAIIGEAVIDDVEKSDELLRDLSNRARGSRYDVTDNIRVRPGSGSC
jgi:hypothetical protein